MTPQPGRFALAGKFALYTVAGPLVAAALFIVGAVIAQYFGII